MPAASNSIVLRDASVLVNLTPGASGGGVEYANQVSKIRLVPDTPIQTYRTLVPDGTIQDVDSTVWTFELAGLQINHSGGLADLLRDNAGDEIEITLQPKVGSGQPKATFTIIALAPEFGGEQGAFLTVDMTFPVVGAPVFGTSS